MKVLNLSWSFLWRLTLLLFGLSFVLHPLAQALFDSSSVTEIKFRPTITWGLIAGLFWVAGAASPRFVRSALWGERLRLSDNQWLAFCRGITVIFTLLAVANVVVANTMSTETWVDFKVFGASSFFIFNLFVISLRVSRSRESHALT